MRNAVPILGVVGGIGAGKSCVAAALARRGAMVVDADGLGHEVLRDADVCRALVGAFSDGILDEAGRIVRSRLAAEAFVDAEHVQRLNDIVHPSLRARIRAAIREAQQVPSVPLVVVDAAVLIEARLAEGRCDAVLFVEAPEAERRRRSALSAAQFDDRTRVQMPLAEKQKQSDFIIHNTHSLEDIEKQVAELWPSLCSIASIHTRNT
jgi:dephospho-CoA kinase